MAKVVSAMAAGTPVGEAKALADEQMSGMMQTLIETVLNMYQNLSNRTLALMQETNRRKRAEQRLKVSEASWQFILESYGDAVWDWHIDLEDDPESDEHSSVAEGITAQAVVGRSPIHPDDVAEVIAALQSHLDGHADIYNHKHRLLLPDSRWSWVLSRGKVVSRNAQGKAIRMVGTHTDITARELALAVYNHSSQGIFVADKNNKIISVNPAFTYITGYREAEVIGADPRIFSSGRHDAEFYRKLWSSIHDTGIWQGEIWNKKKSGQIFPVQLSISTLRDQNGEMEYRMAMFSDITEKKALDEKLLEQANIDPLTRLYNRRMFNIALQQALEKSERNGRQLALLFIDLDYFKVVNDSMGHDFGDQLLQEAARRISEHIRKSDTIARIGGDEFTVILSDLDEISSTEKVATDIIEALSEPFQLQDKSAYISASIGISTYPADAGDVTHLMIQADQAMYRAKAAGRSCYRYFTPSMQREARKRQELISSLHKAVTNQEFQLFYQPILDFNTSRIMKAETLLRWNHPAQGVVVPLEFISVAEKTALINTIGRWVVRNTVLQAKEWRGKLGDDFQVSINISPAQFKATDFISDILQPIADSGVPGGNIMIEITESLMLDQTIELLDHLAVSKQLGLQVALDDFGTGFSSLSHIRNLDIDYIKIDKSFIQNLISDPDDRIVCEAIIVMAHKLNIKVIAEGIETDEQYRLLADMGCDYGQGYLISRPLDAQGFERLLVRPC
jgi:diguanylate cyclase (GGDEF)-like protein/PAS domain S-box-containing protein